MNSIIKHSVILALILLNTASANDYFGDVNDVKTKLIMADCQGTEVTLTLTGEGWGEVIGGCDFEQIILHDTTIKSVFTIKTKSKTEISVGDIIVNGDLKSLSGKAVDLGGNITVTGTLSTLELDDVADDHVITIGPSSNPKAGVTIKFDRVSDTSLDSETPIKSLTVTEWLDTGGDIDEITAPSIDSLVVKGDKKRGLAGDFDADLLLTGAADATKPTLKNGKIAGALTNIIEVDGYLGNLSANQLHGDLQVNGDAKNIKITESLALSAEDPLLGELFVDGYSSITGYKDKIKGEDLSLYSRTDPQLYPVQELCGYYDEGSWWEYLVNYTAKMAGETVIVQNEYARIEVSDIYGDCYEITTSAAGQEVSYNWCANSESTSITEWNIVVEEDDGYMEFSMNINDTLVAPEWLQVKKTYKDAGTFYGTFDMEYLGEYLDGTMTGTSQATACLLGHEEVTVPVDGWSTYIAAKLQETLKLTGTITITYLGYTIPFKFSGTMDQISWGVPGVGIVKLQVRSMKIKLSARGFSETVTIKELDELTDYGPR